MQTTKRIRRTRAEWQHIVDSWQTSNLSAARFCEENDVPYASFCQWRRRFSTELAAQPEPAGFINLPSLSEQIAEGWHITLKLGGDVELVLSRH